MKLLHTSDWHLGQSLNQFDRSFEHAQFLSWLLDTLESEQVDTLLIAGDVFDNTMPIRLTPKDTIGGSFTRRQTLPVVAAPSFWALTG